MNVARRVDAAVEVDRRDERLVAVGEQRLLAAAAGLLLAAAEQQVTRRAPSRSARRASDAVDTSAAFIFDFCPSSCCGNSRNSMSAIDEAEHRVAEELERLVVEDAAAGVLVARATCASARARAGRGRGSGSRCARSSALELVAQADHAAAGLVAVARR